MKRPSELLKSLFLTLLLIRRPLYLHNFRIADVQDSPGMRFRTKVLLRSTLTRKHRTATYKLTYSLWQVVGII
jgi:hypothetical protein